MNDGREKVIARPARPELRSVFRHRAYRLFFTGQLISLLGFWIQAIAQAWLVYRLSDSALLLGLVGFANQVPVLLLSPFARPSWLDRSRGMNVMFDGGDRAAIVAAVRARVGGEGAA